MRAIASGAATYRVQLHAGFTFEAAADIAGYLADLGVTHLYSSPCLQADAGSTHGYDVVDPHRLSDELGGAPGYARLLDRLREAGIGQLLDIVPNHMAVDGRANTWWWDVLENGPSSRYASYFDIDWDPPQRKLTAHVLMPILGDHYGRVLEAGELRIEYRQAAFTVRYYEHEAPLSPRSLDDLVRRAAARAGSEELRSIAVALGQLPHALQTDPDAVEERHRDKEALLGRLADLCRAQPGVAPALAAEIEATNQDFDALDALLQRQNYRLAFWRTGAEELSYRRFFNIETLVGLRMEDERVFADTHRLVLELVAGGAVDGLRVDHIDGLSDPQRYLERLGEASGGTYVTVEKILDADEELPASWPVAGTTGYDFVNAVNRVFIDPAGERAIGQAYARFTAQTDEYPDVVHAAKLEIMHAELAAELERLTVQLAAVCDDHRRFRDYTHRELRDALREMIAAFPVYRPYSYPGRPVSAPDRQHVEAAFDSARRCRPDVDAELLQFIAGLLTLEYPGVPEGSFAVRFAQLSSPVMAKGVEDTAFYRYVPLSSLNEVGGNPGAVGDPVADFHRHVVKRRPHSMLTLSTHDTKRSGDVRARINVLSELPTAWAEAVTRWGAANDGYRRHGWPDRNAEYLFYQTLVGAWPIDPVRAASYMEKATREAKVYTSWVDPNRDYDTALRSFVEAALADENFVNDLAAFLAEHDLIRRGRINSLAQTALLLTCPGVADIYQGTEIWDLSLVDPDNRRPVDYEARRSLLAHLTGRPPEVAQERDDEGGPKLWLIHRLLQHRLQSPACYGTASAYEPLPVLGTPSGQALAFGRGDRLAVVIPRLGGRLAVGRADAAVVLPTGYWRDVLTDEKFPGGATAVGDALRRFPVAVLERHE
jgi:(1->4)-alpha-D-glucan 1-alpha-D-glucosylmutase